MNSICSKYLILGATKHNEQNKKDVSDLLFKISQLLARNLYGQALDTMVVFGDLLTRRICQCSKEEAFNEHKNPVLRALYFCHCLFHQSMCTMEDKTNRLGSKATSSTEGSFWYLVEFLGRKDIKPDCTSCPEAWSDFFKTVTPALVTSWVMHDQGFLSQSGAPSKFNSDIEHSGEDADVDAAVVAKKKEFLLDSVKRLVDSIFSQNDNQDRRKILLDAPPISDLVDDTVDATTGKHKVTCRHPNCRLQYTTLCGAVKHSLEKHPFWCQDELDEPAENTKSDSLNNYFNVFLAEALEVEVQANLTECGDGERNLLVQRQVFLGLAASVDALAVTRTKNKTRQAHIPLSDAEVKAKRKHGPVQYKEGILQQLLQAHTAPPQVKFDMRVNQYVNPSGIVGGNYPIDRFCEYKVCGTKQMSAGKEHGSETTLDRASHALSTTSTLSATYDTDNDIHTRGTSTRRNSNTADVAKLVAKFVEMQVWSEQVNRPMAGFNLLVQDRHSQINWKKFIFYLYNKMAEKQNLQDFVNLNMENTPVAELEAELEEPVSASSFQPIITHPPHADGSDYKPKKKHRPQTERARTRGQLPMPFAA